MDERTGAKGKFNITDNIHARTVEDVLYFNSLLTFAVFIGLSQTYEANHSQEKRNKCIAGPEVHRMLILFEVLAFGFFLSSSLCAKALKLVITSNEKRVRRRVIFINRSFQLKNLLLVSTAVSSLAGIFSLVFSVFGLVQMQLGAYSCASTETRIIIGMFFLVSFSSLGLYITSMILGFKASCDIKDDQTDTEFQQIPNSGNKIDMMHDELLS